MSLQVIKTTMWEQYYEMNDIRTGEGYEEHEVLFGVFHDWKEGVGESVFEEMCPHFFREQHDSYFDEYDQVECDVLDKMIVSYITGKTRMIQKWVRSFEELPPCCPCPE